MSIKKPGTVMQGDIDTTANSLSRTLRRTVRPFKSRLTGVDAYPRRTGAVRN